VKIFFFNWSKEIQGLQAKRALDITDFIVDIVYLQAIVWVGSCYSPIASTVGFVCNLVTFLGYNVVLFHTCVPVEKPYSASRTSNLTYGLLLVTITLCIIPVSLTYTKASAGFCGPIQEKISMYNMLISYIKVPRELSYACLVHAYYGEILEFLTMDIILFTCSKGPWN
jgi:hypothetical protein